MSNCSASISNCQTSASILSSDHVATSFDLISNNVRKLKPSKILIRNYDKSNIRLLNIYLSSILQSTSNSNFTIEDKYNSFTSTILSARDRFVPSKHVSKFSPQYPTPLKSSINEKARLWRLISQGKHKLIPRIIVFNYTLKLK
ncbi:hypothetical protein ACQ4LE_002707 [Meloidogyne hapla]